MVTEMGLFCTKTMCHNFQFCFCLPENLAQNIFSIKNTWSEWASRRTSKWPVMKMFFITTDSERIFCWFVGHIDVWVLYFYWLNHHPFISFFSLSSFFTWYAAKYSSSLILHACIASHPAHKRNSISYIRIKPWK